MGDDIRGGKGQGEIAAIVERISALARDDERQRLAGTDEKLAADLDAALAFLPQLRLRALQALDRDLARPDSLATCGALSWGAGQPGTAKFLIRFCSPPGRHYGSPGSTAGIDAALVDLLLFRDVLLAHGSTMFFKCVAGVKEILGISKEESLAEDGAGKYGAPGVCAVLDTAASLAVLQLTKTSAHITAKMGYAGVDAYADAIDDCHFMTADFARWILRSGPLPERVAGLAGNGRLAKFGISPAELDPERLMAELSKLDSGLQAEVLADWNREVPKTASAQTGNGRRSSLADVDDGGKRSFEVSSLPVVSTSGDGFENHISRRRSNAAVRRLKALSWVACPLAVVAVSLWLARPLVGELLAGPPATAWKGLGTFVLAETLGGALLALGISSLLDLRASGFFLTARELSQFTVLQGRRTADFLAALRKLRPGLFDRSRTGKVPRLFSLCFSREGALLIGGGPQPGVVATFPWQSVREIVAEQPVRGRPHPGGHGQRVLLVVSHGGVDVQLAFPLERAKVAWTSRTFLEGNPVEAALALVQGMRTLSRIDPAVALWEPSQQPQAQTSSAELRGRRLQIARGLAVVALLCAAGPFLLVLFVR
jgi:hypothetical protein